MQFGLHPATTLRSIRRGLLALNVLMVAVCALLLWQSMQDHIDDARVETRGSARLLEQGTRATLDKISIALTTVALRLEDQIAGPGIDRQALWGLVDRTAALVPELQRIGVFDATGQQVCGVPVERCQHVTIADRDYFERLRRQPNSAVIMTGPYPSRVDHIPSIMLSRALRQPDGSFAGVVLGVVPLERLRGLVESARLFPGGAASLRTEQLQLLARHPRLAPAPEGTSASASASAAGLGVSQTLHDAIAAAPQEGVVRAVTASDGIERISAYAHVGGYPVYVLVGQSTEEFLAPVGLQAAWTGLFLLGFMAVSVLLARSARLSRERQEAVQRLYDEAPCGYHSLDENGIIRRINQTELDWLGCERDDVVDKVAITEFFSDSDRAMFAQAFPQLKRTGRIEGAEVELLGRQGRRRRVRVSSTVMHDAQGRFVLSNSVLDDITALHEARQALAEQSRQQAQMLDTDVVGIARVKDRRIVWANRGMARIFGYAADDWRDMPASRLYLDPASYEQTGQAAYGLVRNGGQYRAQLQMRHRDGTPVWIDSSVTELDRGSGEVMLLLVDITPLKAAEQLRIRAVQLEAQNQALREASRAKDEFLSNMSHELRTPLNAVLGYSQLLQSGHVTPQSPRYMDRVAQIGNSGKHLLRLIETMLDYAAIEARKFELTPTRVDVRPLLDGVVELLRTQALAANVDVAVEAVDDLQVVADHERLGQVVFELATNAVKFSHPGGVVAIRASIVDPHRWRIDVVDHGIGIAEVDLPKLFQPFVQLSSGSTRTHGGTGLGLALVQRIVRAMGGEVEVRSTPGEGSTFSLVLPREPTDATSPTTVM